ncbi:MAG: GNAT family N-acetyltransferase [Coriobacteriia bacterium]|nr:GNAT family N-acetyltransferase [Coriobacteriia bacterium]
MAHWFITTVDRGDPISVHDVREILESYHDDLIVEFGENTLTAELTMLPAPYLPPNGALLLARDESGRPAGCVGIKGLSESECEIKRLYVLSGVRGAGLGRALVRAAIDQARVMGYAEMLLIAVRHTTNTAQRIYREFGFEVTPQFREAPLGYDPAGFLFMRRSL